MCSSWISQLLPVEQVTDELPSAALAGAAAARAGSRPASAASTARRVEEKGVSRLALLGPRVVDERIVRDHLPLAGRGPRQLVGVPVVVPVGRRLARQDRPRAEARVDG